MYYFRFERVWPGRFSLGLSECFYDQVHWSIIILLTKNFHVGYLKTKKCPTFRHCQLHIVGYIFHDILIKAPLLLAKSLCFEGVFIARSRKIFDSFAQQNRLILSFHFYSPPATGSFEEVIQLAKKNAIKLGGTLVKVMPCHRFFFHMSAVVCRPWFCGHGFMVKEFASG